MKAVLAACALALALSFSSSFAQNTAKKTFPLGKPITVTTIFCDDVEVAKAIIDARADGGRELAGQTFALAAMAGACGQGEATAAFVKLAYERDGFRVYEVKMVDGQKLFALTDWKHEELNV